jgi:hypothetical protein
MSENVMTFKFTVDKDNVYFLTSREITLIRLSSSLMHFGQKLSYSNDFTKAKVDHNFFCRIYKIKKEFIISHNPKYGHLTFYLTLVNIICINKYKYIT